MGNECSPFINEDVLQGLIYHQHFLQTLMIKNETIYYERMKIKNRKSIFLQVTNLTGASQLRRLSFRQVWVVDYDKEFN